MCFRPGGADSGGIQCPECGKPQQAMGNMVLKKCPFCKCDLEKYRAEYEAGLAAGAGAGNGVAGAGILYRFVHSLTLRTGQFF